VRGSRTYLLAGSDLYVSVRWPVAREQLTWIATQWGDGVLWATVLLYLPAAVVGHASVTTACGQHDRLGRLTHRGR
jgi:hypothetical protein